MRDLKRALEPRVLVPDSRGPVKMEKPDKNSGVPAKFYAEEIQNDPECSISR